ncbi:MAG TPA: SH3 domain-containing protein [Thermomicrobiales bacterium]|nr:SH3 domain-containing protein [Thermomicrobiales bacterium]
MAGLIAVLIVASLTLTPLLESGSALAQLNRTPTRTPTRVPPTATPFPCNTGDSSGMTYTYQDLHRWNSDILSVSNSTGVPANVLKAIMWVESRGMLNARSPLTNSGYYFGLMQVGATSAVPEYMKSVTWMCDNSYNQVLAGGTEMVNKSSAIGSQNWIQVAGAYFGYGTDVTGTTTNSYMQQFANHATALIGTTPGGVDWTPPPMPTPTTAPTVTFAIGSTISVDTDTLNMRANPGLSTTINKVLLQNTSGTVLAGPTRKDNYDWYQIRLSDGTVGWVAGQLMRSGGSSGGNTTPTRTPTTRAGTPTRTPTPGGVAGGGFSVGDSFRVNTYVNFRTAPGYAGTRLRTLEVGTTGTIIGAGRTVDGLHWSNVRLSDGSAGWIASDYITRTGSAATATPTRPASTPTRTPTATVSSGGGDSTAGTVYRTTTRVNIRLSPTTSSGIISTLATGTQVTSLGSTAVANGHTWLRVQAGSKIGWMSMRYLAATGGTANTPTGVATLTPIANATRTTEPGVTSVAGQVYLTTTRVNIRQAPTTSGGIIATLPSGTRLVSLGDSRAANGYTWLRVQAGSMVGWLAMNYISATGGTASTPTGVPTITPARTNTPRVTNTPARPAGGFISGDQVRVFDGPLNYRSSASTSGSIIGTLPTGTSGMVLNGPVSASGYSWYQLQVSGRPNGWVASDFIELTSASVVNGSDGRVEAVNSTLDLTATPTVTPTATISPTPTETATAVTGQTGSTALPTEEPTHEPTEVPTEETLPSETPVPTETTTSTETTVSPTETAVPPTETSTPTETPVPPTDTPTLPPDADGDGVEDALDACAGVADSGLDSDADGLDDACDPTPLGEPTQPPVVERTFESYASADTSVLSFDPGTAVAVDVVGSLPVGGETGAVAYITFYPDQIGAAQVQSAVLYLTGVSGSGSVSIAVANGVAIDEYGLTLDSAPGGAGASGAWVDAGVAVPIDLTGWIAADGPVTIIVSGDGIALGSREGGAPAYLSITVLDGQ